jgi:prepilin-type N-terminal cleavage/methylation domain-containing protein
MHGSDTRARRGYTLVELLVAVAVLSVVMVYVMNTVLAQQRTAVVVDQLSEVQQNTAAIAALVERDIRTAGYMVPPQAAACGQDSAAAPDLLFVSDTSAIQPVDQLPNELAGQFLSSSITNNILFGGPITANVDDVVIDENPSYDTDGDGADDSDFQVGAGAILVDLTNPVRGIACGIVTAVNAGADTVTFDPAGTQLAAFVGPQQLELVPAVVYQIVTPAGQPSELRRNGVTLARDVEDLQVAWFFDANTNGQVDPLEYLGVAGNDLVTSLVDVNQLREIRFNLIVRTRDDDPQNAAAGTGQARENRALNIPGDDARRRRIHTATVRLRNIPL